MTKLFALLVLYKGENSAHILKAAYDLASFGYFQRSSIQEFISFTSKILTERTAIGTLTSMLVHQKTITNIARMSFFVSKLNVYHIFFQASGSLSKKVNICVMHMYAPTH